MKKQINNQMQIFKHEEFGEVRTVMIDGEPWFVGKDITAILGYGNGSRDLNRHVDAEDRQNYRNGTFEISNRGMTIINESGLYSLILSSKLPQAKAFKRWVTSEVLPSIRKYGAFIVEDTLSKMIGNSEFTEALLDSLAEEHAKNIALEDKIETLAPKARYCDKVLLSGEALQTSVIAKDYGMTAIAFNRLLHDLGIQYRIGNTWLLYKEYADKGYTKTKTYYTPGGTAVVHTYWLQKGRLFLYELLAFAGIFPQVPSGQAFII
ncbi:MAG: phage antirepressor KilAC domain-containing protein [Oscillospiraceae bacterium]|nr:phage antirepressor KilAC domain-containing protein [Oscillospiraceae bacterium]